MTGNTFCIFIVVLAIGCGPYRVEGFECHIARKPIIITGDTIRSVNFTWNCTLMSNETIQNMVWLKDDICIAKVSYDTLTPCESYKGRAEQFEKCGISIKNISRKDSGHYNVVILLMGKHTNYEPCQPIYLPDLPEQRPEFEEATDLMFSEGEQSSVCEQQGPSKLVIGLICGILPLAVIIGLFGVVRYLRRKRRRQPH